VFTARYELHLSLRTVSLDLVPTCVWFVEDQVTLDCFSVGAAWNASRGTGLAPDHGTQRAQLKA
jgi:hypothetical protein